MILGRAFEEVGPVLSALTIFALPRPICGKMATKMTMMPRPPSQCVMARKKRMLCGTAPRSSMTVAPVPVRPEMLSTRLSRGPSVPLNI